MDVHSRTRLLMRAQVQRGMSLMAWSLRKALGIEHRTIENPRVSLSSAEAWNDVFKSWDSRASSGANVTVDTALSCTPFLAGVSFLARTLATVPLHAYRQTDDGPKRIEKGLETLVHEAPNPEWTSYGWRHYCWWQVFTGGRMLSWIERGANMQPLAIWPLEPEKAEVGRANGRKFYRYTDSDGVKTYSSTDIIDVPFALKCDQLESYGPVNRCKNAIGLSLAMEEYAAKFFAGGGVPPLALSGPLPQGPEAFGRANEQIQRAIKLAKDSNKPYFGLPPGHELKPVGFEPEKGQMTEARRFQVEEIARALQLPPVFLQDLTTGTFSNTEQQDLHLVKHNVAQWTEAFEQEMNLKLFGQKKNGRYVEHNLDGLMRGDFKTRTDGLAASVMNALRTPNEARTLENLPPLPNGDDLLIQGATVPLGTQPTDTGTPPPDGGNDGNGA